VLVIGSGVAGVGAGALNPAQQASLADVVGRERNGGPARAAFRPASIPAVASPSAMSISRSKMRRSSYRRG